MQLLTIAAICLAIVAGVFTLQNNVPVVVNFFAWSFESSLALVLLMAFAAGAMFLGLASTPSVLRDRWALGRQRRRIEELERICERQGIEMAGLAARLPEDPPTAAGEVPPAGSV